MFQMQISKMKLEIETFIPMISYLYLNRKH